MGGYRSKDELSAVTGRVFPWSLHICLLVSMVTVIVGSRYLGVDWLHLHGFSRGRAVHLVHIGLGPLRSALSWIRAAVDRGLPSPRTRIRFAHEFASCLVSSTVCHRGLSLDHIEGRTSYSAKYYHQLHHFSIECECFGVLLYVCQIETQFRS